MIVPLKLIPLAFVPSVWITADSTEKIGGMKITKRVTITIDFLVVDETELECFYGNTDEDIMGQADTMNDWLREAPYNYSMDYEISEAGTDIIGWTQFNITRFKTWGMKLFR